MLCLVNVAMPNYQKNDPAEDDYNHWLSGMPEHVGKDMAGKGYDFSKNILPLKLHAW